MVHWYHLQTEPPAAMCSEALVRDQENSKWDGFSDMAGPQFQPQHQRCAQPLHLINATAVAAACASQQKAVYLTCCR
jgi:hypothetical protein